MSRYDRRTWQRPAGERTCDPAWEDDARDACVRPAHGAPRGDWGGVPIHHNRKGLRRTLRPHQNTERTDAVRD